MATEENKEQDLTPREFDFRLTGTITPIIDEEKGNGTNSEIRAELNGRRDDMVNVLCAILEKDNDMADIIHGAVKKYMMKKMLKDLS